MVRLNRVLAPLVALLLLAGSVLVLMEVVVAALDRPAVLAWPRLARRLREHAWSDPVVLGVSGAVAAVGLLLLLLELKRRRPAAFVLVERTSGVTSALDRKGLARGLRATALGLDGVGQANATVGRRRARLVARTTLREPAGLQERLEKQVRAWYADLELAKPPRLRISLQKRGS